MSLKDNILTNKKLLVKLSAVGAIGVFIFVLAAVALFKTPLRFRQLQMFPVGPAGEKAYFRLVSNTNTVPQNSDILVKVLLETCGGAQCATLNTADVEFTFDNTKLEPRTPDGSAVATKAEAGILFTTDNYILVDITPVTGNTSRSRVYVGSYTSNTAKYYNSSGKTDDEKVFATLRFKVKAATGSETIVLTPNCSAASPNPGCTNDWINAYMVASPSPFSNDIIEQTAVPSGGNSGNLTLNFTAARPATLSFQPATLSLTQGSSAPVDVMVNPANIRTSGTDALITFTNSAVVEVTNIAENLNAYTSYPQKVADDTAGTVKISGFTSPPGVGLSQTMKIATLTIRGDSVGSSTFSYNFTAGSTIDSNVSFYSEAVTQSPIDLLGSVSPLTVNVTAGSASPAVSTSPSASPSMAASPSPSVSPSASPSRSPSASPSMAASASPSPSASLVASASVSPSASPSRSPSASPVASVDLCHWKADIAPVGALDGIVNSTDLSVLISYWGQNPPVSMCPSADLNNDGIVNTIDIQVFVPWYKP